MGNRQPITEGRFFSVCDSLEKPKAENIQRIVAPRIVRPEIPRTALPSPSITGPQRPNRQFPAPPRHAPHPEGEGPTQLTAHSTCSSTYRCHLPTSLPSRAPGWQGWATPAGPVFLQSPSHPALPPGGCTGEGRGGESRPCLSPGQDPWTTGQAELGGEERL